MATTTGGRPADGDGKPVGGTAGINRLVRGVGEYLINKESFFVNCVKQGNWCNVNIVTCCPLKSSIACCDVENRHAARCRPER